MVVPSPVTTAPETTIGFVVAELPAVHSCFSESGTAAAGFRLGTG
jgi:hypothetical protein